MNLALIVALPFLGALLPGLLIRAGRATCANATLAVTATAFLGLLVHAPAVFSGDLIGARFEWLPQLGLHANFFLDGLGFLFAGLILGIGLLIIFYARFYLSKTDSMGQFYTYLLLFQGAMVGIVLSDNILLLVIFWELTSLSSFLLIGYWKHLPEGRQGARMALAVNGAGGLAHIAGMLLLAQIAGSSNISEIILQGRALQEHPLFVPALLLILIGAFTKSAQFPFHFWLPHAMAAPTPVSAYLHSATMVKAGLFLLARLWPVLSGGELWFWLVGGIGLITMLIGAVIALFKDDLKALLAYSTVSHLGLIMMLLGLNSAFAAVVAVFHVINHATFKAALFMTAGIVDHEAHTRDIKRLGGLRQLMPVTFLVATIASLSMAGAPPLNGFLSKEMMLDAVWHAGLWWGVLATLGSLFSVAYSLRYIAHVFLGPVRTDYPRKPHDPSVGMWAAPALLAVFVVLIGLFPNTMVGPLVATTGQAVLGPAAELPAYKLKLWHGVNAALVASIVALIVGALLLAAYRQAVAVWEALPRPEAKLIFDGLIDNAVKGAARINKALHDGTFTRALAIFVVAAVAFGLWAFAGAPLSEPNRAPLPADPLAVIGWALLVVGTAAVVVLHRQRFLSLVLISIVGLIVTLAFLIFSAPDLAMTQATVEVVTIILMLLALNFLPKETPVETPPSRRLRDVVVALTAGVAVFALSYALLTRDSAFASISWYHLENAYEGGGGTNVVNVILVDFRGFDTWGEIIVLGIAAVMIFAMVRGLLARRIGRRLRARAADLLRAADRHPLLMVVATRVGLPLALALAIYIFLRGHNEPGGGFIAGLVAAIALLMQFMASGFAWAERRQRLDPHLTIALGIGIASLTGLGSWLFGWPFLTSHHRYVVLWPLEKLHLSTAVLFDIGVFLTVVGSVTLALQSLSRLGLRAGETVNVNAMDVDPLATVREGKTPQDQHRSEQKEEISASMPVR